MLQMLMDAAAVEAEIERVRSLSGAALRRRWQAEFGRAAPKSLTADLLRRMIANRIQEQAFGALDRATLKEPSAVDLGESVEVAEIPNHHAPSFAIYRKMMRDALGFPCGAIVVQRKDGALSNEMHRSCVLVQVSENRSERLARVQLLRGLRVFGVHVHHEVGVGSEQSHLAFRVAAVGTMGIGLDEFTDGKPIRGFLGAA
jgi:hypothetical protein